MMQIDYTTVLQATRLLAAAAYDLKLQDAAEIDVEGLEQITLLDGPDAFLEEARETLLRMVDSLNYDDIVGDGQLTGPAMNVAMLEGWCMIQAEDGSLHIEQDDDSSEFADAAAAYAFVASRAESRAPGTKLHQVAIKLAE
jgi:hypothetical protein